MENLHLSLDKSMFTGQDKFHIVLKVLDSYLKVLFEELFIRTRYYDLGLDFVYICMEEIKKHENEIEEWKLNRYITFLIRMKLKMLDYLNEWQEYIDYTKFVLKTFKLPFVLNPGDNIPSKYLYKKENQTYIHFLYQDDERYNIISRKLERLYSGKSIEHLKRHQRNELTFEELEYRRDIVLHFFSACHYDYKNKKWM